MELQEWERVVEWVGVGVGRVLGVGLTVSVGEAEGE